MFVGYCLFCFHLAIQELLLGFVLLIEHRVELTDATRKKRGEWRILVFEFLRKVDTIFYQSTGL